MVGRGALVALCVYCAVANRLLLRAKDPHDSDMSLTEIEAKIQGTLRQVGYQQSANDGTISTEQVEAAGDDQMEDAEVQDEIDWSNRREDEAADVESIEQQAAEEDRESGDESDEEAAREDAEAHADAKAAEQLDAFIQLHAARSAGEPVPEHVGEIISTTVPWALIDDQDLQALVKNTVGDAGEKDETGEELIKEDEKERDEDELEDEEDDISSMRFKDDMTQLHEVDAIQEKREAEEEHDDEEDLEDEDEDVENEMKEEAGEDEYEKAKAKAEKDYAAKHSDDDDKVDDDDDKVDDDDADAGDRP